MVMWAKRCAERGEGQAVREHNRKGNWRRDGAMELKRVMSDSCGTDDDTTLRTGEHRSF